MIIGSIPFINDNFGAVLFFLFIALGVFLITSANIRMNGYDRLLELNEAGKMSEEFVPKSDRKVNKAPIIICAVVALCVAFTFGGISVVKTLMSGVFIKSDYVSETMSTTYDEIAENSGEELKTVKVDAEALEVIIKRGEGEGLISVDYSGPVNIKPEVTFENGKLVVKQRGKGFNFNANSFNGPSLEIVIGEDVQIDPFRKTSRNDPVQKRAQDQSASHTDQRALDVVCLRRMHEDRHDIPAVLTVVAQQLFVRAQDQRAVVVLRSGGPVLGLCDRVALISGGGQANDQRAVSPRDLCPQLCVRHAQLEFDRDLFQQQERTGDFLVRSMLAQKLFADLFADGIQLFQVDIE
jgi:hypothetical protein